MTLPIVTDENKSWILIIYLPAFYLLYFGVGGHPLLPINNALITPLDYYIPLLPWSVSIYISYYFLVYFGVKYSNDNVLATQTLYAYFISTIIAGIIFAVYPTSLPQNTLTHEEFGFISMQLFKLVYTIDVPTNWFPSLHTTLALIAAHGLRSNKKWATISFIWAVLIMISTLTTKQHVIPDMIAGICLYYVSCYLSCKLFNIRSNNTYIKSQG